MAPTRGMFPIGTRSQEDNTYASQIEAGRRGERIGMLARYYQSLDLFAENRQATKAVYCIELQRWFVSCADAARAVAAMTGRRVKRSHVGNSIKRHSRLHKLTFTYEGPAGKPRARIVGPPVPRIFCVELNREFRSATEAAEAVGLAYNTVRRAAQHGVPVQGLHFVLAGKRELQSA